MNEEKIRKVDIEGKPYEAISGVSIFRTRQGEDGKPIREVLLVKGRKMQKWYFPGGKIREGEDPVEAARRELSEELGVDFRGALTSQDESVGHYHYKDKDLAIANFVLDGSLVGEPAVQDGDNIEEFGWFSDPFALDLALQTRVVLEKQMLGVG